MSVLTFLKTGTSHIPTLSFPALFSNLVIASWRFIKAIDPLQEAAMAFQSH